LVTTPEEVTKNYIQIINQLEEMINLYQDKYFDLRETGLFNWNDVRLSFYQYTIQHIDALIHLLMYNTWISSNINFLMNNFYLKYNVRNRFNEHLKKVIPFYRNRENINQFIANQYSFSVYSTFEFVIRCISMKIYEQSYIHCSRKLIDLVTRIMKKSKNYEMYREDTKSRLENYNRIRNAVHNNGVFYPTDLTQKDKKFAFEFSRGEIVYFEYGKPISSSFAWKIHLKMTEDLFYLYDQILSVPEIRNYPFIADPSDEKVIG
jgi:hypothetical protein